MEPEKIQTSLPENAYRELKPGEEYTPVMPASSNPKEVTPYSVTMGVVMAVVFSAAAAFLGLKVGQVFEAAIPIAIIAVGMGSVKGYLPCISLTKYLRKGISSTMPSRPPNSDERNTCQKAASRPRM